MFKNFKAFDDKRIKQSPPSGPDPLVEAYNKIDLLEAEIAALKTKKKTPAKKAKSKEK